MFSPKNPSVVAAVKYLRNPSRTARNDYLAARKAATVAEHAKMADKAVPLTATPAASPAKSFVHHGVPDPHGHLHSPETRAAIHHLTKAG